MKTEKTIITNLQTMRAEKQRLKNLCRQKEEKIKEQMQYFREHFSAMAVQTILPFEKNTNEKIDHTLDFVNENILPGMLGLRYKKEGSGLSKKLLKIGQALIISMTFQLAKKYFSGDRK